MWWYALLGVGASIYAMGFIFFSFLMFMTTGVTTWHKPFIAIFWPISLVFALVKQRI